MALRDYILGPLNLILPQLREMCDAIEARGVQQPAILDLTDNVGGTVSNALASIPNPTDSPASADALRDDLVTNVLPAIRNSVSSLASKVDEILAMAREYPLILDSPFAPLVYASFFQNNSASSLPACDTGQTFSVLQGAGSMGTFRYGAYISAAGSHSAVVEANQSDGIAIVQCVRADPTGGFALRADATRYLQFRFYNSNWDLANIPLIGSPVDLASGPLPNAVQDGDWFSVEMSGSTLKFKQNNVVITTQTITTNQTATKHGIYIDSQVTRLKHFLFLSQPATTNSIRVTDPVPYRTRQRSAANKADIPISGTYIGTPTAIQARFNNGAWQTIVSNPTGGSFSGVLTDQAMGQGWLEVRFTNDHAAIWRVPYVAIGDVFAVLGQSNAEGRIEAIQFYTHASLRASVHDHGNAASTVSMWREMWDPTDTSEVASPPYNNSIWPLLATKIMAHTGVPVGFITTAHGQSGLFGDGGTWMPPSSVTYLEAKNAIVAAAPGGLRGILWYGNESDARGEPGTQTALENALKFLRSQLSTDLGFGQIEMWLAQISKIDAVIFPAFTRNTIDLVRLAQTNVINSDPHMHVGPILYDINTSSGGAADGVHITTAADGTKEAVRWWHMLKKDLYDGTEGRGPVFNAVTRVDATHIDVTFTLSGSARLMAGTPPTAGWRVTGGPTAVSAAVRQSNTVVRLTVTGGNVVAGTTKISWASFNDAAGVALTDNTTDAMPAEPFVDQTVV